ncbi:hypothetical protein [Kitasatospora purpeofusca]|uniref:hypothetical protein n=1 Tax=Kitasatospora purpeofusca TaxID=67352 RepID=UPI003F4AE7AF
MADLPVVLLVGLERRQHPLGFLLLTGEGDVPQLVTEEASEADGCVVGAVRVRQSGEFAVAAAESRAAHAGEGLGPVEEALLVRRRTGRIGQIPALIGVQVVRRPPGSGTPPDLARPEGLAEHRQIHGDLARSSGRRASPLPHNAGFRISNMTVVQSAHGEAGLVKRWPTRPIRH